MAVQMRYGDYIKEGFEIVKANIVPSIVLMLIPIIPIVGGFIQMIAIVNFMAAVKAAKHEGKPIQIGDLFNFENVADKLLGPLIVGILVGIGMGCLVIPGIVLLGIFYFVAPTIADRPGTPFVAAIKANLAFGKGNILPLLLLAIVNGLVVFAGVLACGLGVFITGPVAFAATYLAYEDHKSTLEAAAAEGGVQL